jgi:hypothetical protein
MSGARDKQSLGVGQALTAAAQWRLLLVWTVGLLVPTAIAALPIWRLLAAALDLSPRAADIARRFDILAFEDVVVAFGHATAPVAGALFAAGLAMVLLQPLLAGVSVAAARQPFEPLGLRALLERGMAYYGRMFRLLLLSLLPLVVVVGGLSAGIGALTGKMEKHAVLESRADLLSHLSTALTLILFIVVHATIEAARAQLAADERLRSAWRAWVAGLKLLVRRPLALLGLYLGPTLVSLVVASVLLLVRIRMIGANAAVFWLAFIVTQLAVAAIGWGRAARLFALTDLMRVPAPAATYAPPVTRSDETPASPTH